MKGACRGFCLGWQGRWWEEIVQRVGKRGAGLLGYQDHSVYGRFEEITSPRHPHLYLHSSPPIRLNLRLPARFHSTNTPIPPRTSISRPCPHLRTCSPLPCIYKTPFPHNFDPSPAPVSGFTFPCSHVATTTPSRTLLMTPLNCAIPHTPN